MHFSTVLIAFFAAIATAQRGNPCGFPNGPDCKSLGDGANGLEQFQDDGCCVFPLRCGNGDGGQQCELVGGENVENRRGGRRVKRWE